MQSTDTSHPSTPLILYVPSAFANRIFSDSLLSHLSGLRKGSFRKHTVISCNLCESYSTGITNLALLSSLVGQVLVQCPSEWVKIRELYGEQEVKDVLDGQSTYLLESLLWRYLKALLSGYYDICVVCVISFFAFGEQPGAKLDRMSANTQEESGFRASVMLEFTRKLFSLSDLIDSNFKLMVILPTGVVISGDTSLVMSNLASDNPHFDDCVRDDVTGFIDSMIEKRPGLSHARPKLLDVLQSPSSDPLLAMAFAKYVEVRGFASPHQIEKDSLFLSSSQDVFEAILCTVPESDRPQVRDALLFVCFATRPLTIKELGLALAMTRMTTSTGAHWSSMPVDIEHDLSTYFSALVYFDGERVHLAHPILEKILCQKTPTAKCPDPWYHLGSHPHLEMARRCLRFLQVTAQAQSVASQATEQADSNKDSDKNGDEDRSKDAENDVLTSIALEVYQNFLDYSVMNWTVHYIQAITEGATEAESADIMQMLDDSLFQIWQRTWHSLRPLRSIVPEKQVAEPILRQSPHTLAKRAQLHFHQALAATFEALHVLRAVDGKEDIALAWGMAQVGGNVERAKRFWLEEIPEEAKDMNLLLRCFGRNPELAFRLVASIDQVFVHDKFSHLLVHDLDVGGTTALKYLGEHPSLNVPLHLDPPSAGGWSCTSLGLSEVIEYIIVNPNIMLVLRKDPVSLVPFTREPAAPTPEPEESVAPISQQEDYAAPAILEKHTENTLLHIAVAAGNVGAVKALLARSIDVDSTDEEGMTAVALASRHGFNAILDHLLQKAKKPNQPAKDGKTPLYYASQNGHYRIASRLVQLDASPFNIVIDGTVQSSCFLAAMRSNHEYLVKLFLGRTRMKDAGLVLVARSIEKNVENEEGLPIDAPTGDPHVMNGLGSAVMDAVARGFSGIAMDLIEKGISLDGVDGLGNTVVHWAARNGMRDVLGGILARHATSINAKNIEGDTALQQATSRGHSDCVSELLGHKADPGIQSVAWTPIELAARNNLFGAAKALLEKKQESKALGEALQFAVLNGHVKIVTLLLDAGADKDYVDNGGNTALQLAAFYNQERAVEILLARRANLEPKDDSGRTALADAARNGYQRIVKLLLEAGADVSVKDEDDRTPFDLAVINDCKEVVTLLLSSELKKDDEDEGLLPKMVEMSNERAVEYLLQARSNESTGNSGLNLSDSLNKAIKKNNSEIVSMLLDYGADPNDPNVADLDRPMTKFGFPIHLAAYNCQHNVAKVLLTHNKRKANVNLTGGEFWTALHACISGLSGTDEQIKMFSFLVQNGADPTIQGGSYGTLLHYAVARAPALVVVEVLSTCKKRELTLDTPDNEGRLPSHFAVINASQRIFDIALLPGPTLGAKDIQGRTPMHFAAGAGSIAALEHLLSHSDSQLVGDYLQQKDGDGWNALHWACRQKDKDVVQMILDAGAVSFRDVRTTEGYLAEDIAIFHNNSHFIPLFRDEVEWPDEKTILELQEMAWNRTSAYCDSCRCVCPPASFFFLYLPRALSLIFSFVQH